MADDIYYEDREAEAGYVENPTGFSIPAGSGGDAGMSTDRELLELAAKAIGLEIKPVEVKNVTAQGDDRFIGYLTEPEQWPRGWFDPLTNDGDTFRLETKMSFTVVFWAGGVEVGEFEYVRKELRSVPGKSAYETYSCHGGDKNAARRKAATRAAAEVGRAMP